MREEQDSYCARVQKVKEDAEKPHFLARVMKPHRLVMEELFDTFEEAKAFVKKQRWRLAALIYSTGQDDVLCDLLYTENGKEFAEPYSMADGY